MEKRVLGRSNLEVSPLGLGCMRLSNWQMAGKRFDFAKMNEKDLESFVQQGISNSKNYGLENEDDLKLYIECMIILSPNFDQDQRFPWAKEILTNEDLDGEAKMASISEHMIFGLENPK